jgi:hypothetical protein
MTAGRDRTAGAGGALEPARVATAPVRPSALEPARVAALTRVARPVAGVGGLLLVEILGNPRARAAVGALARSLGRRLAPETAAARPPAADRSAIACQVTVVQEPGALSVLVRCVETALAVPSPGEPPPTAADR